MYREVVPNHFSWGCQIIPKCALNKSRDQLFEILLIDNRINRLTPGSSRSKVQSEFKFFVTHIPYSVYYNCQPAASVNCAKGSQLLLQHVKRDGLVSSAAGPSQSSQSWLLLHNHLQSHWAELAIYKSSLFNCNGSARSEQNNLHKCSVDESKQQLIFIPFIPLIN